MDSYDVIIVGTGPEAARLRGTSRRPASGSCCSSAATGFRASRRTGWHRTSSSTTAMSPRHLVRRAGQGLPAADPLLRRRRDEALRRRAYRLRAEGLRRAPAPRRHLTGVADLLRRARALLHEGRAAVRGARRPWRGPDRASRKRAVPVPGRLARAADPAALRRSRRRRLPPLPRALRHPAREQNMPYSACVRCANCDGFPCAVHGKSDAEVLGVRPALEHPNVTLLTNAKAVKLETNEAGTAVTEVVVERDGELGALRRPTRRPRLRRGEHGQAAPALGERQAPERARQRLRPGRPQLHVPQQLGRARALARARTRPSSRRRSG